MSRLTQLRALAPLVVAGALAAVAVVTVERAGCDDPGRYELRGDHYELVGGCIAAGDIVVTDPVPPTPTVDPGAPNKG
ncbi:hypothetical protein [Pseudonocardia sp. TRM90224]|uniref:hypothetical protein n=1 Tax=Pseudonocardia sp. TRM90224 TaxID=2812678 RepID=UPI001E49CD3E|nr:hypothetical protein [Pseudonocardia sp. TRM90224]